MPIEDPYWPRADTWLLSQDPDPEVLMVGVPTASSSLSPSQAHRTPAAVRNALSRFSTFHGEWGIDLQQVVASTAPDLDVQDLEMHSVGMAVEHEARQLPPARLTLFVGGDNAITRPLARAVADDALDRLGVITFDAHHDVRTLEHGPTNGTPIRGLIHDGLPGANVVQIGIHSFANSLPYRRWCDDQGIGVVTVAEVGRRGMDAVVDETLHRLSHCDRIYVDVDLDVLDRAYAPGCPGARPGGLTIRDLAAGVRRLAAQPEVAAFDFVEVDPDADIAGITVDALCHALLSAAAGLCERSRL